MTGCLALRVKTFLSVSCHRCSLLTHERWDMERSFYFLLIKLHFNAQWDDSDCCTPGSTYSHLSVRGRGTRLSPWPGLGSSFLLLLVSAAFCEAVNIIKSSLPSGDALGQPTVTGRVDVCVSQPISCLFHTSRSGKQPVKTDWKEINSLRANYAKSGTHLKSLTTRLL